jgi:taurine dioxygenase
MAMGHFEVERLGYALGARVTGLDLRAPPDASVVADLRDLWLEYQVLCFPDQDLDKFQHVAFAGSFGELEQIRPQNRDPDLSTIGYLTNLPRQGKPWNGFKSGADWHSDESYTTRPTMGTFVLAKQVPPAGGDTMFANQYLAYGSLSSTMKDLIEHLEVLQSVPERAKDVPVDPDERPAVQPVVRVHPETKRKALYLDARATKFVGMTEEESRPLIGYLSAHAVRYEFCYRHRWSAGDLVMWDNRALLHIALRDYDEEREARYLFRAATLGEPSGREYTEADLRVVR